jgi:DNA-binding response OmpR family regulator
MSGREPPGAPRLDRPLSRRRAAARALEKDNRAVRVLIVDEEDRFREVTAALLARHDFIVHAAANAQDALREMGRHAIDVAVLDLKVSGMDGDELLPRLRERRPELEVIFLSGRAWAPSELVALGGDVFDFLTKPCPIELLEEKIREASGRSPGLAARERRVGSVMVPIASFSSVGEDQTVLEAVEVILNSFIIDEWGPRVHECVHRSVLIRDRERRVAGIVDFADLLQALKAHDEGEEGLPPWGGEVRGLFTVLTRKLAGHPVREFMKEAPPVIEAEADLMKAAGQMQNSESRRLLVTAGSEVVGVLREQDLFFECCHLIRECEQYLP